MPKFADYLTVSFKLDVLLFEDPTDFCDNVGRFGVRDLYCLGLAIDEETEDLLFMVPAGISSLELFERDVIFATYVAVYLR